MVLDDQQRIILKKELKKSLELLGKEPVIDIDEYVCKDFEGYELIMVLKALKDARK